MGKKEKNSNSKKQKASSINNDSSLQISKNQQQSSDPYQVLSVDLELGAEPSEHNIAVMHNFIARAVSRWSLEESKLFICALSQISNHDENGWIKLSKRDLNRVLEYKNRSSEWLRRIIKNIALNSWLHFDLETGWDDGFIVNRTRSDRWNVYIRFEKDYLPLLEKLTSHFTTVYVESIAKLNHKSSYSLYLYLKSWADHTGKVAHRYIYKKDIHSIFNLSPGSYIKNPKTDRERFDWYSFEKYCLIPAIADINRNEMGEIEICEVKKVRSKKNSHYIDGYYFSFRLNNRFMESLTHPRALEHKAGARLRMTDSLPPFEEIERIVAPLNVSAPEVFKRLAEQHKKRDINDWKSYCARIAANLQEKKSSKRKSELPEWYTYIPTESPSPELLLQSFILESMLNKTNLGDRMDHLMSITGLSREKIEFYINNPDELDKVVANNNKR